MRSIMITEDGPVIRGERTDAAAQTAVMVFPLYYLALALTMTAAILTIQQLIEILSGICYNACVKT